MSYEKTIHFDGNIDKALEIARNTLIPHGFTIVTNTDESVELDGPGTLWTKGQNPLVGVSKISVSGTNNELAIKAEFGGILKAIIYLIIFIVGMSVFFLLLFGIFFYLQGASTYMYLLPEVVLISPTLFMYCVERFSIVNCLWICDGSGIIE